MDISNGTHLSRFIQMKIHFIIIIITVNAISIMVIECKACCHRRSPRHHHQAISFRKTHAQHTISFVLSLFELSCELSSARLAKCDRMCYFKRNAIHPTAHFAGKWKASNADGCLVWPNDEIATTVRNVWPTANRLKCFDKMCSRKMWWPHVSCKGKSRQRT